MNQKQRDYLSGRIREVYNEQKKAIEKTRRPMPNLNNYLLASFMDGSIRFGDLDLLKAKIRERVLAGGDENMIVTKRDRYRGYNDDDDGANGHVVAIPVDELFVMPQEYVDALGQWEQHNNNVGARLEELRAKYDTLVTKVNLGSDKALSNLIAEADNLVDISLMNSKLLLTA